MDRIIPAKYYHDAEIYELEKELIFEKEWLFVGMKTDLPNAKDWFTIDLLGKSVIVYNTGTSIKAFQNVCAHRFARIFTDSEGAGPIYCKYHAWVYDSEGVVLGKHDLCPDTKGKACLKSYPVETVGDFIFIHLGKDQPCSLKQQLTDELYGVLQDLSGRILKSDETFALPHSCNWKFIVENVMEQHHCVIVHKDTLVKTGYCGLNKPDEIYQWGKNSTFTFFSTNHRLEQKRQKFMRHVFEKEDINDQYKHYLLYPNSVLTIFEGVVYTIGRVLPQNNDESVFLLSVATAPNKKNAFKKLVADFNQINTSFIKTVFAEDKYLLDSLQAGVKEINHDGFQYTSETRVGWFTESYLDSMGEK